MGSVLIERVRLTYLSRVLRKVSRGVALIAHRRRVSQLVHHHGDSKEPLKFKAKLNTAFQALVVG